MAVAYPSYFLSASAPCKPKTYYNRFPALHSSFQRQFQATCWLIKKECSCSLYVRPFDASRNYLPKISCAMNMSAGQWNGNLTIKFGNLADKARKLWDASPQQVKSFPWMKALKNFIQLVLHLVAALVKFLFVPVFAISSISEMSYCAHEKKLVLVPFLVIFGITAAGVLKETVLDMSPRLQEAEVPWHLISIMIFCVMIKLPGPYYPFWGRILIPHFANGILLRTLMFLRSHKALKMKVQQSYMNGGH